MSTSEKVKRLVAAAGVSGVNKPKLTPKHPTKKGIVVAKEGDKVKTIRFGAQGYGHNYSKGARSNFKSRHGKNIKKGKMSAAYWADKKLWAGKGKSTKAPPKGQKHVKGKGDNDVTHAGGLCHHPSHRCAPGANGVAGLKHTGVAVDLVQNISGVPMARGRR